MEQNIKETKIEQKETNEDEAKETKRETKEEIKKEIGFVLCGKAVKIEEELIPNGCYLHSLINTSLPKQKDEQGNIILTSDQDEADLMGSILGFLKGEDIPNEGSENIMSFWQLTEDVLYTHFMQREEYFRNNMRKEGFENHPMNTNPYYDLIKLTPWLRKKFRNIEPYNEEELLFKTPYNNIFINNSSPDDGALPNCVFIAGGYVFGSLFNKKAGDIDYFIYGCNQGEAVKITEELLSEWKGTIVRTKNSVTSIVSVGFEIDK